VGESDEKRTEEDEDQEKAEAAPFGYGTLAVVPRWYPEDGNDGKHECGHEEKSEQLIVSRVEVQKLAPA
jgi:hypothetical protein